MTRPRRQAAAQQSAKRRNGGGRPSQNNKPKARPPRPATHAHGAYYARRNHNPIDQAAQNQQEPTRGRRRGPVANDQFCGGAHGDPIIPTLARGPPGADAVTERKQARSQREMVRRAACRDADRESYGVRS